MSVKEQSDSEYVRMLDEVTTRCSEVFLRTAISQSIVSSALEISKSFDVIRQRSLESHLSGESGVLNILVDRQVIKGISSKDDLGPFLDALALQTTVNAEMAISAAAIILSHSTADDVFTAACQMAMDLAPEDWVSEVNLDRTVSLKVLKEKGRDRVFKDELRTFRNAVAAKSITKRADLLFSHVPVKLHGEISKDDVAYFRLSKLKEMDELRHNIVHADGLQRVRLKDGTEAALFFHEAAHTALRSLANNYGFTLRQDILFKGLAERKKA